MMRHVKLLLVALLVAFSASAIAEAAPKKAVRHRPKHSTRVAAGASSATGARAGGARRKSTSRKKATVTRKRVAAKKKAAGRARASATRRPATKPR